MKKIVLALVSVLCVSCFVNYVYADSTSSKQAAIDGGYDQWDLIFIGKVTEIKPVLPVSLRIPEEKLKEMMPHSYLIDFEVEKIWKQVPDTDIKIRSASELTTSACGIDFEDDQFYLVFAKYLPIENDKRTTRNYPYTVSQCKNMTRLISEDEYELLHLINQLNQITEGGKVENHTIPLDDYDYVFTGTVKKVSPVTVHKEKSEIPDHYPEEVRKKLSGKEVKIAEEVEIIPDVSIFGELSKGVTLYQPNGSYKFIEGKQYIIFANKNKKGLIEAQHYSLTRPLTTENKIFLEQVIKHFSSKNRR